MANEDDQSRRQQEGFESDRVDLPPFLGRLILSSSSTPFPARQTFPEREGGIVPGRPSILRPASTLPSLSSTGLSKAAASSSQQAQIQEFAALVALSGECIFIF